MHDGATDPLVDHGVWSVVVRVLTNRGVVRAHNEDAWSVCGVTRVGDGAMPSSFRFPLDGPVTVWIADGMGGHGNGATASGLALQCMEEMGPSTEAAVAAACRRANERIAEVAAQRPGFAGMGTTLCGVVVTRDGVVVANVGDSMVFQLDDGLLHQVGVEDRSRVQAGALSQCLGGGPHREIEPHVTVLPLRPSRYLLCTDGLTDMVPVASIEELLQATAERDAVTRLVGTAMASGGRDNVTVASVDLQILPAPPRHAGPLHKVGWA